MDKRSSKQSHGSHRNSPALGIECAYEKDLQELEREADIQYRQLELSECLEYVAHLVDLFNHRVILPQLQLDHDWQDHIQEEFKRNKGVMGNHLLDTQVEKAAIKFGLTREQWKHLLYLNLIEGDRMDMTTVSRSHLRKVHDMAARLLEGHEQATVFTLINAIEKHMPSQYFINK